MRFQEQPNAYDGVQGTALALLDIDPLAKQSSELATFGSETNGQRATTKLLTRRSTTVQIAAECMERQALRLRTVTAGSLAFTIRQEH